MIAKGNTHHSGTRLAAYMLRAKDGEKVQVAELRGFASDDIREAFRAVDVMAIGTQCEKPMFHAQVRLRDGERLTPDQWRLVADRIESKLGLSGQARAIVFHVNQQTRDTHMHIGWSRIDEETVTARNLAFFKLRLKEVARELESELRLTPVSSRRKHPEMAATRAEDQQARRLGVDINKVRRQIRDLWDQSFSGQAFARSLANVGLTIAKGDRRDFVVVDPQGGIHALGKRILGCPVSEVRAKCADLQRSALPSIEEARTQISLARNLRDARRLWARASADIARRTQNATVRLQASSVSSPDPDYTSLGAEVLAAVTRNRATFTADDIDRSLQPHVALRPAREKILMLTLAHDSIVALPTSKGSRPRFTTREILQSEQEVLVASAALSQATHHGINVRLDPKRFGTISAEQWRAVLHSTKSSGLSIIDGQAGTGKSYTMAAIRDAYSASGYRIIGLSPTNAVAQAMKEEGFAVARTVHSELLGLQAGRTRWNERTVVMVDEAAMLNTRIVGQLAARAQEAGAKLILVGDDRQLSSIERGGMFEVLKQRHGAAQLTEVRRQKRAEERTASGLMAKGRFAEALSSYARQGSINWSERQSDSGRDLIRRWARDSARDPAKTRFVFAYTNSDVDQLNEAIRDIRLGRSELGRSYFVETKHGLAQFAVGDRVQFTGTDKRLGLYNGQAGTVRSTDGRRMSVILDGKAASCVSFNIAQFRDFRHGYAGTIYKGQGRTIDATYLYHSEHWRNSSSYVAMTRHSHSVDLFVAREIASDLSELARQMARLEERRAASFYLAEDKLSFPPPKAQPFAEKRTAATVLPETARLPDVGQHVNIVAAWHAHKELTKPDLAESVSPAVIDWERSFRDPVYRKQIEQTIRQARAQNLGPARSTGRERER